MGFSGFRAGLGFGVLGFSVWGEGGLYKDNGKENGDCYLGLRV